VALWREGRHTLLIGLSATVMASAVVFEWNLFGSSSWIADFPRWQVRPTLILFQCAVCLASVAALKFVHLRKPAATSVAAAALAMALALTASIDASVAAAHRHRRDYDRQMALREASLTLRPIVSADDIVLVQWPSVRKSHLYVMYWSGIESFEVTRDRPIEARMALLPRDRRIFLLRDSALQVSDKSAARSAAPSVLVRIK
jgi:hypothetical protein